MAKDYGKELAKKNMGGNETSGAPTGAKRNPSSTSGKSKAKYSSMKKAKKG